MNAVADEPLVAAALDGDDPSFGQLVEKYQNPLFNAAFRILHNREDARDVTQTAFVKAYEHLDSYDPKYKFFSWIYKILINETKNLLSKRQRSDPFVQDLVSPVAGPEEACRNEELRELVDSAIVTLTREYRALIVLRHFGNLSYEELSYVLDLPVKTVKSRLYTARQKLCGLLIRRGVTEY